MAAAAEDAGGTGSDQGWASEEAHQSRQTTARVEKTATEKPRSPPGTAKPTGMSGEYHGSEAYLRKY